MRSHGINRAIVGVMGGGGGGGVIALDDFTTYATGIEVAGLLPPVNNGNPYVARHDEGKALSDISPQVYAGAQLGGYNSGFGIDTGVYRVKLTVLISGISSNNTNLWVGGDAIGGALYPSYRARLLPPVNGVRLYENNIEIAYPGGLTFSAGMEIVLEYIPGERFSFFMAGVLIYEKTVGVISAFGQNAGVGFGYTENIDSFSMEEI